MSEPSAGLMLQLQISGACILLVSACSFFYFVLDWGRFYFINSIFAIRINILGASYDYNFEIIWI